MSIDFQRGASKPARDRHIADMRIDRQLRRTGKRLRIGFRMRHRTLLFIHEWLRAYLCRENFRENGLGRGEARLW